VYDHTQTAQKQNAFGGLIADEVMLTIKIQ